MNATFKRAYWSSVAAYETEEEAARILEAETDLKLFATISKGPIQAIIASCESECHVSFRGTEGNISDWITNLKARLVKAHIGRVHKGFLDGAQSCRDKIIKYIKKVNAERLEVDTIVSGHSQGGALASAFLYELLARKKEYIAQTSITFGSPRVFDRNAAAFYNHHYGHRTFRFVNNNDIVARLPCAGKWFETIASKFIPFYWMMPFGYRHVGIMNYIDVKGEVHRNPSRLKLFKDRIAGRVLDFGVKGTDGLKDHSMVNYGVLLKGLDSGR